MKAFVGTLVLLLLVTSGIAQVHVRGYYRKDGTYVQPHYRSSPDGNPYNNYSYPGNVNPYTGKVATGNPSTYLANYYKTYPRNSSDEKFDNYTSVLCNTNYKGLRTRSSYTLTNNFGKTTGYVYYYQDRTYKIYDPDFNHVGYVMVNKKSNRYKVYDLYGYKVSSSRGNAGPYVLAGIACVGLGALLAISFSE